MLASYSLSQQLLHNMAPTRLFLVYGVLVTRGELETFVRQHMNPRISDEDLKELIDQNDSDEGFCRGVTLQHYKCCSPLSAEKYILGNIIQTVELNEIAEKPCFIEDDIETRDHRVVNRLVKKFGLGPVRTYFMYDDCVKH